MLAQINTRYLFTLIRKNSYFVMLAAYFLAGVLAGSLVAVLVLSGKC
jgi:hypothetical protein